MDPLPAGQLCPSVNIACGILGTSREYHLHLNDFLIRPKHCYPCPKGKAKDTVGSSIIFLCSAHTVLFKRLMRHIFSIKKLFQNLFQSSVQSSYEHHLPFYWLGISAKHFMDNIDGWNIDGAEAR